MNQNQVQKRYFKEFITAIGIYVISLIISIIAIERLSLPQVVRFIIAILPVVPIGFVFVAIMRKLKDSDELQQKVQSHAIMFAAVATALITFGYGFLENIGFPKFPTIWIFPMMFMLWGFSLSYFWKKYQ